ncbi:MAG: 4a-hydroxytetrahydrobiopterin dehydratase [Betaproteobacteria bacterium]|jgi:4a-hydroxytetrahydrobiopterin dehydratase|nr:4a-hydroxytetrahydrobiopterin dehydratase [Betaproteobacteria bacterium]NBT68936.1 4a-hydroxytetrahydrobiopterin dehydratase [Betaproteobacteria bacterium]NBY09100.1 4a-hydroxytetrahydrobiopterin dehydratase [Betaproteobacteria bacterium]
MSVNQTTLKTQGAPVACGLDSKKCVPCEGGVPALTSDEAQAVIKQLNNEWKILADGREIHRHFNFSNFFQTMSFVNALAHIANTEDHHPDLSIGYNYCKVIYTTHAINGLSENDFICAAKIDRLSD